MVDSHLKESLASDTSRLVDSSIPNKCKNILFALIIECFNGTELP